MSSLTQKSCVKLVTRLVDAVHFVIDTNNLQRGQLLGSPGSRVADASLAGSCWSRASKDPGTQGSPRCCDEGSPGSMEPREGIGETQVLSQKVAVSVGKATDDGIGGTGVW